MAKKAGGKSITWGLLSEAKADADRAYQSREFAGRQLTEWLLAGKLRWRSEHLEGSKRDCDPGSGDPEFWREPIPVPPAPGDLVVINLRNLVITWDQSHAERNSYTYYRIEVAMNDLAKLLPKVSGARKNTSPSSPAYIVASKLFPGGVPLTVTTPQAVQKLGDEMQRRNIQVPSPDTLKRALGRR